MIQIIGVSGRAYSGKDYIAKHYVEPWGFMPFALAWPMKTALVGREAMTFTEAYDTKPPMVRDRLQQFGTEEGRDVYGHDVWCRTARAWFDTFERYWNRTRFVVTDVRFPNEVAFIQQLGGRVMRVLAPARVNTSAMTAEARAHSSETALDDYPLNLFDGLVYNDPADETTVEFQVRALITRWGMRPEYTDFGAISGCAPRQGQIGPMVGE